MRTVQIRVPAKSLRAKQSGELDQPPSLFIQRLYNLSGSQRFRFDQGRLATVPFFQQLLFCFVECFDVHLQLEVVSPSSQQGVNGNLSDASIGCLFQQFLAFDLDLLNLFVDLLNRCMCLTDLRTGLVPFLAAKLQDRIEAKLESQWNSVF